MSIGIYLQCDSCGRHAVVNAPGGFHAGHALRAEAKAAHWKVGVESLRGSAVGGWRDFCEQCCAEAQR